MYLFEIWCNYYQASIPVYAKSPVLGLRLATKNNNPGGLQMSPLISHKNEFGNVYELKIIPTANSVIPPPSSPLTFSSFSPYYIESPAVHPQPTAKNSMHDAIEHIYDGWFSV